MTQPGETDTHEIKPASHCLSLKPNLSFMAQTETTERKRGGESDTSVGDGGVVRGWRAGGVAGSEKSERKKGEGGWEHISDRTQQQPQQLRQQQQQQQRLQVYTVSLPLFEHHSF